MPMLSALAGAPYPTDDALRLLTVMTAEDAPAYYFNFFTPTDHTGEEFILDRHSDLGLLPERLVDPNFLTCRYERLFPYRARPGYYCVPWMGVRYAEAIPNAWKLHRKHFRLRLGRAVANNAKLKVPTGLRKLRLRTTGGGKAIWFDKKTSGTPTEYGGVNLESFIEKIVELDLPDQEYPDDGIMVTLEDATDNDKIVGRLRIVFLKEIELRTVCLKVENVVDNNVPHVKISRMLPNECPRSLESRGPVTNYAQGYITDDANKYGFGPLGIVVNFDAHDITIELPSTGSGTGTFLDPGVPMQISAASLGLTADPQASTKSIAALLDDFSPRIANFDIGGQDRSKFSAIFVFSTPFQVATVSQGFVLEAVMGVAYALEPSQDASEKEANYCWSSSTIRNVSLFKTEALTAPLSSSWERQKKLKDHGFVGNVNRFITLVHELSHALLVSHFFAPEEVDQTAKQLVIDSADICKAHRWLRLYIHKNYVANMYADFDTKKVKFKDFKVGTLGKYDLTLFDAMIALGAKDAVNAFIQTLLAPAGPPPAWAAKANDRFHTAELVFWSSLNQLVQYGDYNPGNIMNNISSRDYAFKPNSGTSLVPKHELYVKHSPVQFNRFQWELMRRTVERMQAIAPL